MTRTKYHHPPVRVARAAMSAGLVDHDYAESIAMMTVFDAVSCQHLIRGGVTSHIAGPLVALTRNRICTDFCTQPELANCDWLLWFDADMVFSMDTCCRLMDLAYDSADQDPDKPTWPIVSGLYFGVSEGEMFPQIFMPNSDGELEQAKDFPEDEVITVGGVGFGIVAVHRSLIEKMGRPYPEGFGTTKSGETNMYPWFAAGAVGGRRNGEGRHIGEDLAFCQRAIALGVPGVRVDTGLVAGHAKRHVHKLEDWKAFKRGDHMINKGVASPREAMPKILTESAPPPTMNRAARRAAARGAR